MNKNTKNQRAHLEPLPHAQGALALAILSVCRWIGDNQRPYYAGPAGVAAALPPPAAAVAPPPLPLLLYRSSRVRMTLHFGTGPAGCAKKEVPRKRCASGGLLLLLLLLAAACSPARPPARAGDVAAAAAASVLLRETRPP